MQTSSIVCIVIDSIILAHVCVLDRISAGRNRSVCIVAVVVGSRVQTLLGCLLGRFVGEVETVLPINGRMKAVKPLVRTRVGYRNNN